VRRRVLFLGDSNVVGYPTASGFRAPVLDALNGASVLLHGDWESVGPEVDDRGTAHAGFNGYASTDILRVAPTLAETYAPDLVIVSCGGNDFPDGDPMEIAARVASIGDAFACPTMTCLPPSARGMDAHFDALHEVLLAELAGRGRSTWVAPTGPAVGRCRRDSTLFADECHLSARGHDVVAEVLVGALQFAGVPSVAPRILRRARTTAATGASASIFVDADGALRSVAPNLSEGARQIVEGLVYGESGFGISGSWAPDGVPSHNWGALIYVNGNAPRYIVHGDHDAHGNPTTVKFAAYATAEDGAAAFMRTWGMRDTLTAAQAGDAWDTAAAMYGHHYYSGTTGDDYDRIALYASMIKGGADRAARERGVAPEAQLVVPSRAQFQAIVAANPGLHRYGAAPTPSPRVKMAMPIAPIAVGVVTLAIFGGTLLHVGR
jgi:lysophospholipase L1-like esterase